MGYGRVCSRLSATPGGSVSSGAGHLAGGFAAHPVHGASVLLNMCCRRCAGRGCTLGSWPWSRAHCGRTVHVCSCMLVQLGAFCLFYYATLEKCATNSAWRRRNKTMCLDPARDPPEQIYSSSRARWSNSRSFRHAQPPDRHSARLASVASTSGSRKARRGWQHPCRGGFQGGLLQRSRHLPHHMAAPGGGHGVAVPASQTSLAAKDDKKSSSRTVTDTITGAVLAPWRLGKSWGELPAGTQV